ncbi:MAG: MFS transporter [Bdellovibrionales bacterium]|nr:MFS transporter [Bdellovibrionales bacterium]
MKSKFQPYQIFVIALLAFLQFTLILDFMILAPLGAILMPELKIDANQFAKVVSVYAFSAGTSGFLSAGFADRFDRKKMLLFFYVGFLVGTFLCGIAPNYSFLLMARTVTGLFGGVIGSIVFAITTDLFEFNVRGRVMGTIQTAFAASQILGIPFTLYLANHWGWHFPFLLVVGLGAPVILLILFKLKPINAHLKIRSDKSPFRHLLATVRNPRYALGLSSTALLSIGGFLIMPFSSAFSVNNLGVGLEQLPMVYLVTGLSSMFLAPLAGKLSDSWGKYKVFVVGSIITPVMVIIYTHLDRVPLHVVLIVSVLMFAGITSRMISSQALLSAVPEPAYRGSFMAIGSAIQQVSGGLAAVVAGWIVVATPSGRLENFNVLGYVMVAISPITLYLIYKIDQMVKKT